MLVLVALVAHARPQASVGTPQRPRIHFAHVPKTAGSGVTAYLRKHNVSLLGTPHGPWSPRVDGRAVCNERHTPPRFKEYRDAKERQVPVLAVVRQPYDRMVSAYRFQCWASRRRLARELDITEGELGERTA